MTGEDVLTTKLSEAQSELNPNQIIDPTVIVSLINAIFELIRGCKSPDTAGAHISRGSAMTRHHIRRMLKDQGYEGDIRAMTNKLAAKGESLTPEELRAILTEADELPAPTGFWPQWAGAVLLLLCLSGSTMASDFWPSEAVPSSSAVLWPQQITKVESTLEKLSQQLDNLQQNIQAVEARTDETDQAIVALRTQVERVDAALKPVETAPSVPPPPTAEQQPDSIEAALKPYPKNTIILMTMDGCIYCPQAAKTEDWFKKAGWKFQKANIDQSAAAKKLADALGIDSFPTFLRIEDGKLKSKFASFDPSKPADQLLPLFGTTSEAVKKNMAIAETVLQPAKPAKRMIQCHCQEGGSCMCLRNGGCSCSRGHERMFQF